MGVRTRSKKKVFVLTIPRGLEYKEWYESGQMKMPMYFSTWSKTWLSKTGANVSTWLICFLRYTTF